MSPTRETPPSDNRLVWYAGYGSNLLRSRFDCYLSGGTPKGSTKAYTGCRDRTAPRGDRPITIPHQLYFADHSPGWNGAVAFVRRAASDATTYARMYLITYGQFNDVVRQENGRTVPGDVIVPPYDDLAHSKQLADQRYPPLWLAPQNRHRGRVKGTARPAVYRPSGRDAKPTPRAWREFLFYFQWGCPAKRSRPQAASAFGL
jgi:hypothetical protein